MNIVCEFIDKDIDYFIILFFVINNIVYVRFEGFWIFLCVFMSIVSVFLDYDWNFWFVNIIVVMFFCMEDYWFELFIFNLKFNENLGLEFRL